MQDYIETVRFWELYQEEHEEWWDKLDYFIHGGKPDEVKVVKDAIIRVLEWRQDFYAISLAVLIALTFWASREEDRASAAQMDLLARALKKETKRHVQDASVYHSIDFVYGNIERLVLSNVRDRWILAVLDYEVVAKPSWTEIEQYINGLRFHIESDEKSEAARTVLEFLNKKRHRFS